MNQARPQPLKRERRKEERPAELIAAALKVFADRGFAQTRIEDIAREAGVAKGTAYLYFATKEDIFRAVITESLVSRISIGEDMLQDYPGSAESFLDLIINDWLRHQASPEGAVIKLIMAEAGNFPELAQFYNDEVMERGYGLFSSIIQIGMARGEFRPVDPAIMARVIAAPLSFLGLWRNSVHRVAEARFDDAAYLQAYRDLILHGLRAAPAIEQQKART